MDAGRRGKLTMRRIRFDGNFPRGQSSNAGHEPLERRRGPPPTSLDAIEKACELPSAIDVRERGEKGHAEAASAKPRHGQAQNVRGAPRHRVENRVTGARQAEKVVASVGRGADYSLALPTCERVERGLQVGLRELGCVIADDDDPPIAEREGVLDCKSERFAEVVPPLVDRLCPRRQIERRFAGNDEIRFGQSGTDRSDVIDKRSKQGGGALRPAEPQGFSNSLRLRRERKQDDRRVRAWHNPTVTEMRVRGL